MNDDDTNQKLTQHLKEIEERLLFYQKLEKNKGSLDGALYTDWERRVYYEQSVYKDEKKRLISKFPELADKVEQLRQEIEADDKKAKAAIALAQTQSHEALTRHLGTAYDCYYSGYPTLEEFMKIYAKGLSDSERKNEEDKLIKHAAIIYEGSDGHFHC